MTDVDDADATATEPVIGTSAGDNTTVRGVRALTTESVAAVTPEGAAPPAATEGCGAASPASVSVTIRGSTLGAACTVGAATAAAGAGERYPISIISTNCLSLPTIVLQPGKSIVNPHFTWN